MIRKIRVLAIVASIAAITASLSAACKESTRPLDEAGKPIPKLYCKLNNQCWVCPDDAAMKKCIINPTTSGCKQAGITECP